MAVQELNHAIYTGAGVGATHLAGFFNVFNLSSEEYSGAGYIWLNGG